MKISGTTSQHSTETHGIDVLFLCEKPLWPQDQGFRVHGYQMARSLTRAGFRVAIACMEANPTDAPIELKNLAHAWPSGDPHDAEAFLNNWRGSRTGTWLRRRIADHQGLPVEQLAGALTLVQKLRPRAVVGVGMHSVLMLRGLPQELDGAPLHRVWYAADELVYFNLTCLPHEPLASMRHRLRTTALHLALERAFTPGIDAVIAVSPMDATLLRRVAGAKEAITIRNGVDLETFSPSDEAPHAVPRSLVFWGRMDFEPNVDAVTWFAHDVWPLLRERHPDATWNIVGKNPRPELQELNNEPGINLVGGVPDVRTWARAAAVTVLPMRCGGGIKNKLLEAAAMGLPIVASPRAVRGLELGDNPPTLLASKRDQWVEAIDTLWSSPTTAAALGAQARVWVERYHHWDAAAEKLADAMNLRPDPMDAATPGTVMPINTGMEDLAGRRAA